MTIEIRENLESMGYTLTDCGENYRSRPIYREGNSKTVLSIRKSDGRWFDFKTGERGDIVDLIQITLGLKTRSEASKRIDLKKVPEYKEDVYKIRAPKFFNDAFLGGLEPDHSYWEKRGIREITLERFRGGVEKNGAMKSRYVFPIFDESMKVIGMSGRKTHDEGCRMKWKHKGKTATWVYPTFLNKPVIQKTKEVILVESIGDMLALWERRVRGAIVVFGLNVNNDIINFLLSVDPESVRVCFNRDLSLAGQNAAKKAKKKLDKFFDCVDIVLPTKNDFGEMSEEEIDEWTVKNNIKKI
jgi:hypothetical protein